jgi:hypothetical protein
MLSFSRLRATAAVATVTVALAVPSYVLAETGQAASHATAQTAKKKKTSTKKVKTHSS